MKEKAADHEREKQKELKRKRGNQSPFVKYSSPL